MTVSGISESRSWLDPRIDVAPSSIDGLGLFAREPVKEGEVVIRWHGEILPIDEFDRLKERERYDCAALSEATILVFAVDDPVIHCNHSCDSNLWMEDAIRESARRDIDAGEELTVDYALLSDDPTWQMPCSCGSPLCRRIITGSDWKRRDLHERYAGHFSPYLSARYAAIAREE
jgi:SET domain-containing protein